MWTRTELKDRAKKFLKDHYFIALGMVVLLLVTGAHQGKASIINFNNNNGYVTVTAKQYEQREDLGGIQVIDRGDDGRSIVVDQQTEIFYQDQDIVILKDHTAKWISFLERRTSVPWKDSWYITQQKFLAKQDHSQLIVMSVMGLALLFAMLISNPISYGGNRFFLHGARGDVHFSKWKEGFVDGNYGRVVGILFMRDLFLLLWYLLLIIPGIIKHYEYALVPYLMSDHPQMGYKEVLQRSMQLTEGHKWQMFVLDLSFIGWYILGSLLLGIGRVFVHPYVYATQAQLYLKLVELDQHRWTANTESNYPEDRTVLSEELSIPKTNDLP